MVTKQDVKAAAEKLGVKPGDSVLVHSSFKSLGPVENGAGTVVAGFLEAVGEEGTLIFPTLSSNDWYNLYKNWTPDTPSDVGYLTNYFRQLPEARRSHQPTHSVAAIGKDAEYLTKSHGQRGRRFGTYGNTPFAKDSPWEKMYKMNTKMIFLGVPITKCTLRHYVEYCFVNDKLDWARDMARTRAEYEAIRDQIWYFGRGFGMWPHIQAPYVLERLDELGKPRRVQCGNAELLMVEAKDFADMAYSLMEQRDKKVFQVMGGKFADPFLWLEDLDKLNDR